MGAMSVWAAETGEQERASVVCLPLFCVLPRCGLALTDQLPEGSQEMERESKLKMDHSFK